MKKKIECMITAFRDGFQSAYGARVFTEDFLPAVEAAAAAGIDHFEAGGGARFQSLYFYCNEDAFDMMESFRKAAGKKANLQTLARGVNVVGLDSQPRDIIKMHAQLFKKHGITTIRNFDALNDVNNLIYSGQCIVDAGLNHEVCVTLMALPPGASGAHTPEFYNGVLKKILDAGIPYNSVCFKDASGTATPKTVFETIKKARSLLGKDKHITFHTHETAGCSILCYRSALDASADQIDLSMAPVSGGTCQPDIITMWHALRGSEYDLGIDIDKLREAEEVFKECMSDYFTPPEAKAVEPLIPFSPMPGGALTANTQMMRDNGILDKYSEVAAAMGEVVERGGFGTSVTPVSQFYFQQAFNNVMAGPWKKIAEGYGKMVLGYFGKTPEKPDPEIVELARKQLQLEPTDRLPVDINDEDPNKGADMAKKMLEEENLPTTDENIFIAATCKEKGIQYLKGNGKIGVRKKSLEARKAEESSTEKPAAKEQSTPESAGPGAAGYTVYLNGNAYQVSFRDGTALVNGKEYTVEVEETRSPAGGEAGPGKGDNSARGKVYSQARGQSKGGQESAAASSGGQPGKAGGEMGQTESVEAPMPGLVLRIEVKPGDAVNEGDALIVLESMKMETPITATATGTIQEISVSQGDQVKAGDRLMVLSI